MTMCVVNVQLALAICARTKQILCSACRKVHTKDSPGSTLSTSLQKQRILGEGTVYLFGQGKHLLAMCRCTVNQSGYTFS
jgi:hypothetical protein